MAANRLRRAVAAGIVLLGIAAAVVLISINTGTIRLSPAAVIRTLFGNGTAEENLILFDYRLPRIIITILAGAGLSVAGAVLQGISRNALADPGILGIHSGAAFGLIVFVSFFRTMEGPVSLLIPLFTFTGGLIAALIIFAFAYDRHRGIVPIRLILVGICIGAGLSALTLMLSLHLDETTYTFTARWLAGSVWGREWVHVWTLLPWIVILTPIVYFHSRTMDAFGLGDELAVGVGTKLTPKRLMLLLLALALSCISVATVGGIGFIGLIAPHIAKRLAGPAHRHFLPLAALIGVIVLTGADTVGRALFQPVSIPAGVVVSLIGGPYFLYLLFRSKHE